MATRFGDITAAVNGWLEGRAPRERKLLLGGAGLAAAALVYNVLWAPAWDGSQHLRATLPALQEGLVHLQAQADIARGLRAASAIRPLSGTALRDALSASLNDFNIPNPNLVVVGQGVQVDAKGVPFSAWMDWIEAVRTKLHVRVVDAHAVPEAHPGLATVSATLQQPGDPG
jgi:general secretion pathway protein M